MMNIILKTDYIIQVGIESTGFIIWFYIAYVDLVHLLL